MKKWSQKKTDQLIRDAGRISWSVEEMNLAFLIVPEISLKPTKQFLCMRLIKYLLRMIFLLPFCILFLVFADAMYWFFMWFWEGGYEGPRRETHQRILWEIRDAQKETKKALVSIFQIKAEHLK